MITNGFQNGAEINAETHQKSLPKLVPLQKIQNISYYAFLNGKVMQIHYKSNGFILHLFRIFKLYTSYLSITSLRLFLFASLSFVVSYFNMAIYFLFSFQNPTLHNRLPEPGVYSI